MRLPFIKLEQDAYVRGRTMARRLKIPIYAGVGIAAELFAWGLDMAPTHNGEVDLSGDLLDDDPAGLVAAAVGWDGDAEQLFGAMVRVGFIAAPGEQPARIRGLDRYAEVVITPEQRSQQAKNAADIRWAAVRAAEAAAVAQAAMLNDAPASTGIAPALLIDAQTQTQTQTQNAKGKRSRQKDPDPRLLQLSNELRRVYVAHRHEPYKHGGTKDDDALTSLLPLASDPEIARRWSKALLLGDAWPGCSTFAQLSAKWNDLAAPEAPKKGRAERFDPNDGVMRPQHQCADEDCPDCGSFLRAVRSTSATTLDSGSNLEPAPEAA